MDRLTISDKVISVFRKIFPDEKEINLSTTADDIVKWDSLNHIILIRELEEQFNIRFDLFDIIEIRDVNGMVEYISSKTI